MQATHGREAGLWLTSDLDEFIHSGQRNGASGNRVLRVLGNRRPTAVRSDGRHARVTGSKDRDQWYHDQRRRPANHRDEVAHAERPSGGRPVF